MKASLNSCKLSCFHILVKIKLYISTVCPKKRTTYFQMAVTHFRIVKITKVGGVLVRAGADLSNAYNYFSVTQLGNYFLTHGILGQPSLPIGSIPRGRDH